MRLAIVGAGKVGQTLGKLALNAGYEIGEVICRSKSSAARSVKFIGSGIPQSAAKARIAPADIVLISTPDDSIGEAAALILRRYQWPDPNASGAGNRKPVNFSRHHSPVALHTSGALSSAILKPLRDNFFSTGSCHPLQTFESPARAIDLIAQSFFCIEGDKRAVAAARRLVKDIGGKTFQVPTDKKSLYHAAAVLASGGVIGLLSVALDALTECGLSQSKAKSVVMPLVNGAIGNVRDLGPARALTGPVRRGDLRTIQANLEALSAVDAAWAVIYNDLGRQMAMLARTLPDPCNNLAEILTVFGHEQIGKGRRSQTSRANKPR